MELLQIEKKDRIGYIRLNRPEKRNALSFELVAELKAAFTELGEDKQVKVIVLTGEGKVFCAGADLAYLQQLQNNTFEENLADSNHLKELFYQIYTLPKIVIAQVNGHALAGGCGLASVCDFAFSVPEAKFGYTEVRIGFVPAIVKVFLLRKIGETKAKELLLSGELIDAAKAKEYNLINEVIEAESLHAYVREYAEMLTEKNSGQSMAFTKQMIAAVQSMSVEEALDFAARKNAEARASEDCKRGVAAFLNKEPVQW